MLSHLALAAAVSGRLQTAQRLAAQATGIVDERGWAPLVQAATAHLALAIVHLQRNEMDEALGALAGRRAWRPARPGTRVRRGPVPDPGRCSPGEGGGRPRPARAAARRPGRLAAARFARALAAGDRGGGRPRGGKPAAALERVRLDRPEEADDPLVPNGCCARGRCSSSPTPRG